MWYYSLNNQPTGPVDDKTMKTLITAGTVTPGTLVWQEGMAGWQAMSTTALASLAPISTTPPPAPGYYPQPGGYPPAAAYYGAEKPAAMQIKELNDLFMWYWICLIGIIITLGLSAIASAVLFYIIVYRSWKLIQDGYARTTPGKAIGFCFIPFYNFYWIFQAFPGLAKDTNAFVARRSLAIPRVDDSLPTVFCILTLCSAIPYVGYVTAIGVFVLQIIMLKNFKNTAVAIIQQTQR